MPNQMNPYKIQWQHSIEPRQLQGISHPFTHREGGGGGTEYTLDNYKNPLKHLEISILLLHMGVT